MHFGEQAGDPDAGHESIETTAERDDPVALLLANRADGETLVVEGGVGDGIGRGRLSERLQPSIERCGAFLAPCIEAVGHGEPQTLLGAHEVEGRPRQQIILEATPGAAALDPDVAGAQPVAQMDKNRDLPGADIEIAAP